ILVGAIGYVLQRLFKKGGWLDLSSRTDQGLKERWRELHDKIATLGNDPAAGDERTRLKRELADIEYVLGDKAREKLRSTVGRSGGGESNPDRVRASDQIAEKERQIAKSEREIARLREDMGRIEEERDRLIHSLKPPALQERHVPNFAAWWKRGSNQELDLD